MAKQLTAPGCIYTIVARVDTTIYSPDQNWVLDVPAGQHDFIAETNEVIIPADAMMRRKTRQHAKDRNRINLLGIGPGSLVSFITRAIERIVGKGNVEVTYGDGKMTVVLAASVTYAQVAMVESLLERMLPKDVTEEISDAPIGYTRLYFLESTGVQYINSKVTIDNDSEVSCTFESRAKEYANHEAICGTRTDYRNGITLFYPGHTEDLGILVFTRAVYVHAEFGKKTSAKLSKTELKCGDERYDNEGAIAGEVNNMLLFCVNTNGAGQITYPYYYAKARVYSFSISRNSRFQLNYAPCLDPTGKPCMFDLARRQAFYNAATTGSDFIAGMTWEQVRGLRLPTAGGKLTLSLPYEASIDSLTQAALEQARANGWELTLQYDEVEVPAGYSKLDFLESTGTQWMVIPFESNGAVTTTLEMQWTDISGRQLLGYNANSLYFGVNDQREGGWDSSGVWDNYSPLDKHQFAFFVNANGRDGYVYLDETALYRRNDILPLTAFYLWSLVNGNFKCMARVFFCHVVTEAGLVRNLVPCLDETGKPCMYDTVTQQPFRNWASLGSDFTAGMTWEQVRKLQLPTIGGQLTLSLPYEASLDGIAQTALEQARANGWELILQYDEAKVPEGYSKLDFLEGTGVQWLDTGIKLSNESEVTCSYYVAENVQGNGYLFGASAPSETSDGIHFKYLASSEARPERVYAFMGHSQGSALPRPDGLALVTLNSATFKCNENSLSFKDIPSFETKGSCVIYRTRTPSGSVENWGAITNARIYTFNISRSNSLQLAYIPCLDQAGVPCMFDLVSHQSFYNKGAGQFTAGMTTAQALNLASLPVTEDGALTVSLPWEAQWDTGVQNALNTASANGWTITVQYRDPDVGAENIPVSFLESTGTQYIDTGIKLNSESEIRTSLQSLETELTYNNLYGARNGSAECFDCFVGNNKKINIDLPAVSNLLFDVIEKPSIIHNYSGATINSVFKPVSSQPDETFESVNNCALFTFSTPAGTSSKGFVRIYAFSIARNNQSQLNFIPALDRTGRPCMFDAVTGQLFHNAAATGPDFIVGMTLEQVRDLSLPAGGGQLTLALPYEASLDGLAQDALERARANGWVLTLQYDEAEVPAGYSKLEYLQSRPRQNIMITDYVPDNETGIFVSAALDSAIQDTSANTVLIGCRTDLQTDSRFMAPRIVQYPSTGTQGYGWGTWRVRAYNYRTGVIKYESSINWLNNRRAVLTFEDEEPAINDDLSALSFTPTVPLALFGLNLKDSRELGSARRIYVAKFSQGDRIVREFIPCLDSEGVPCMYDLATKQSFRNSGSWQFIAGMTLEQVRGLSLPAGGGNLTLALPFEASIDKQAQVALEQARENGWELTLQYDESDVPAGYRKLDFLESTGTQYIDTGVKLSSEDEVECQYIAFDDGNEEQLNYYLFGSRDEYNLNAFDYMSFYRPWGIAVAYCGGDGTARLGRVDTTTTLNTVHSLKQNVDYIKVDESVFSYNSDPVPFECSQNCWLGSKYGGASVYNLVGRVYSFSISRAGETQLDYVPCITPDGKLGMYNKIDGTLQENAGTGSFIAGLATVDDVLKLWLPETGGELTISVPADTPDSAVNQLRTNNPNWQIAIQYRTDNEN